MNKRIMLASMSAIVPVSKSVEAAKLGQYFNIISLDSITSK